MDTSTSWILASLLVSSIGFVLLHYGRKLGRPPQAVVGILMLVYPYFVPGVVPMAIVAAALLLLLWLAVRLGW
jgi:lipopolysaccharide export LptBFGC system permease protein LptF